MVWDGRQSLLYCRLPSGHWTYHRAVKVEEIEVFMENEIPPADYAAYDQSVQVIGRRFYLVRSVSRPEVTHVVDLEPSVYGHAAACSCEKFVYHKQRCHHVEAVESYLRIHPHAGEGIVPMQGPQRACKTVPMSPREIRAVRYRRAHPHTGRRELALH